MASKRSGDRGANGNQGMNWITQQRRLAIYLRDGLACVWCTAGIEDGDVILTLDHLLCREAGGSHRSENLVTCCRRCNSVRQDREPWEWAEDVAQYLGQPVARVIARVKKAVAREVPTAEAKAMIARRGSAKRAVDALRGER